MQKIIKSDKKIKYTLLSIIFLILFMVTTISYPINTYAGSEESSDNHSGTLGQQQNGKSNSTNELDEYNPNATDASLNQTAVFLYWAASSKRCGIYFYVIDSNGSIMTQGVLLEEDEYNGFYADYVDEKRLWPRISAGTYGNTAPMIEYVAGISPVGYDDSTGWYGKGTASMNYLASIMLDENGNPTKIDIDGVEVPCPYWAYYVAQTKFGANSLKELKNPETKWQVFMEPVSVNYLYTTNYFPTAAANGSNNLHAEDYPFAEGGSMPVGHWVEGAEVPTYEPTIFLGTASTLLDASENCSYTLKLYHRQLPFSLCLEHDEEIPLYHGGGTSHGSYILKGVPGISVRTLNNSADIGYNMGIAIAALDISGLSLPPIHTFDTTTPGYPETPDPEKGTDGDCVITKLYYTEVLSSDGVPVETKDFHKFSMSNTTNYISIDEEEGYEIEAWRTSSTSYIIQSNSIGVQQIKAMPGTGSGSSVETLDADNGEKYLYVLYKKVEVEEESGYTMN